MIFPSKYKNRIDYWEGKGLRKSRPGTKIFDKTVELLKDCTNGNGVYQNEAVPMNDFRLSVDRFAETVFNPEFRPVKKSSIRNTPLADFIYNPFVFPKRKLLYFTKNEPEPVSTLYRTELYDPLCHSYVQKNGTKDVTKLSSDQRGNISLASSKLTKFFKEYKGKIDTAFLNTDRQKTDLFVRHVLDQLKDNLTKFNTRALTYNSVWEMLPNFFQKNGYFVVSRQPTMRDMEEKLNERTRKRPTLKRRG